MTRNRKLVLRNEALANVAHSYCENCKIMEVRKLRPLRYRGALLLNVAVCMIQAVVPPTRMTGCGEGKCSPDIGFKKIHLIGGTRLSISPRDLELGESVSRCRR